MITTPAVLLLAAIVWVGLTVMLWRTRRWLAFYLTGAFGFVLLAISVMRSFGLDAGIESLEAAQVTWMARIVSINVSQLGGSGLAIPNHTGWAVFDIGIECSALLETFAFAGLVGFYPAFVAQRKAATIAIGMAATWVINLLRILLIVSIINAMGTSWVFSAHAVFGRIFFFAATVTLYWYLVTRPTVNVVAGRLEAPADE